MRTRVKHFPTPTAFYYICIKFMGVYYFLYEAILSPWNILSFCYNSQLWMNVYLYTLTHKHKKIYTVVPYPTFGVNRYRTKMALTTIFNLFVNFSQVLLTLNRGICWHSRATTGRCTRFWEAQRHHWMLHHTSWCLFSCYIQFLAMATAKSGKSAKNRICGY